MPMPMLCNAIKFTYFFKAKVSFTIRMTVMLVYSYIDMLGNLDIFHIRIFSFTQQHLRDSMSIPSGHRLSDFLSEVYT